MASSMGQSSNATRATAFMLAAVGCYSLIPLLIVVSESVGNPLFFVGVWRIGALASYVIFMLAAFRPLIRPNILSLVARRLLTARYRWLVLLTTLSTADYALFAQSTKLIGIASTSVLFEVWPLITIMLLSRLYGRKNNPPVLAMAMACIFGAFFVMASQAGGFHMLAAAASKTPTHLTAGVCSATGAAVLTSLTVCSFKCGSMLQADPTLIEAAHKAGYTHRLDLFSTVLVFMIANMVSIPLNLSLGGGLGLGQSPGIEIQVPLAVFGGVALASGAVCWQMANAFSSQPGINAMGHLTPLVALLLLWTLGKIGSIEPPYLIIGAASIVSANLWIHFRTKTQPGPK